ncbi:hypothetical protein E8E12_011389 [Didymella heteroderae]|uniref:Uncharacterized protein n=1 Tax=Didymella heteroderae TaxID=1769908 RepID=A0A9P4X0P0_9PLEO|nr:hypothetical protein E8E12_011389 [Didymella heteroderae]
MREPFRKKSEEAVTTAEWNAARKIAQGICSTEEYKTVVTLLLLSIKPRHRFDPKILEVYATDDWATWMNPESLEPLNTISEYVPEYTQFVQMMYDVQFQARCRTETPEASNAERGLSNQVANLSIAADAAQGSTATAASTRLSLSAVRHAFYMLGPEPGSIGQSTASQTKTAKADDASVVNSGSQNCIDRPLRSDRTVIWGGAKEMWQAMMFEERDEQETTVLQIEDGFEEDRPCIECGQTVSETCYRRGHFAWCTAHQRMIDGEGLCSGAEHGDRQSCTEVQADMDEHEAYWAEVEENAIAGGAGFRDFD